MTTEAITTEAMTMPAVRADVEAFYQLQKDHPRPEFTAETIAELRPQVAFGVQFIEPPVGELAVIQDAVAPAPAGDLKVRLFDCRAERVPGPVIVYFHGGGFVIGDIDLVASLNAEMSRRLDLPVISVEYRLAPEHPWPAAPDDAEAVARWVADPDGAGPAFGRRFTSLVISGDSAGGTLTLVTGLALRDQPAAVPVDLLLAFYPATDFSREYPSQVQFAGNYGISDHDRQFFNTSYRPDYTSWRGAPLVADLAGLAPTIIAAAELDILRDQGRAFAAKAIAAGVPTMYLEAKGNIHGYATFRLAVPSSASDLEEALAAAQVFLLA
jgi:acetyl esterase